MSWGSLCPCHCVAAGTSAPCTPGTKEIWVGPRLQAGTPYPPSPLQLSSILFLLFLCSAGPCYLPLSLTPSSSCLKFRLWTFPLGAVLCLFCVSDSAPHPQPLSLAL